MEGGCILKMTILRSVIRIHSRERKDTMEVTFKYKGRRHQDAMVFDGGRIVRMVVPQDAGEARRRAS